MGNRLTAMYETQIKAQYMYHLWVSSGNVKDNVDNGICSEVEKQIFLYFKHAKRYFKGCFF